MRSLILCPIINQQEKKIGTSLQDSRQEFTSLCKALPYNELIDVKSVAVKQPRPGTFFNSGKLLEFKELISSFVIGLVLVDYNLSPIQQRNLERVWEVKILDRNGLILEIFADRAKTREGVLQVRLAFLEYQKTRLVRSWTHLERQRGGIGIMAGPGESQIESDRREISKKIIQLKKALTKIVKTRNIQRVRRLKQRIQTVALVGYTNAGKSSVFNYLTKSTVFVKDMLFATLDPKMKKFQLLSGPEIILSDTVGFISDLPTQLVSAFRATLEEVVYADLIIHVRDISHEESEQQAEVVKKTLEELNWHNKEKPPIIEVLNKTDLLSEENLDKLRFRFANSHEKILISAKIGYGFDYLQATVLEALKPKRIVDELFLSYEENKKRSWLFNEKIVVSEKTKKEGFFMTVNWTENQKYRFFSQKK